MRTKREIRPILKGQKLISVFLIICFAFTNFLYPVPSLYAQSWKGVSEDRLSHSPKAVPVFSDTLANLSLPSKLGKIDEISAEKNPDQKTVILIQDAHAIPDAQKNIRRLLDYLQKKFAVDLITIEGTSGKLDATLLRAFPDQKILGKVITDYLKRGEFSGAAAASILNKNESEYYGVEDQALYEKTIDSFLAALADQDKFQASLKTLHAGLTLLKKKFYSKELFKLDQELEKFNRHSGDFVGMLEHLKTACPQGKRAQILRDFPHLAAVVSEMDKEGLSDERVLHQEIKKFAAQFRAHLRDPNEIRGFNGKLQEFTTERTSAETFAQYLFGVSQKKHFKIDISQKLQKAIQTRIAIKQMTGSQFFEEFEAYVKAVKEPLLQSRAARTLDGLSRQCQILEKLAQMKLSRSEWEELQTLRAGIIERNSVENRESQPGERFIFNDEPLAQISEWRGKLNAVMVDFVSENASSLNFYRLALERDKALSEKLLALMRQKNKKVTVLVTGGFHTQGIKQILKEKNISCVLISPSMKEIPEDHRYDDFMQGRVSWSDYFKIQNGRINLYEAFHRATVHRLLAQNDLNKNKNTNGLLLREWRDNLIRRFAGEGKITGVHDYLRFLDSGSKPLPDLPQIEQDRKSWLSKVGRFLDGLKILKMENKITPENIMNLTNRANATVWNSIPNAPGFSVPGAWYIPREKRPQISGPEARKAAVRSKTMKTTAAQRSEARMPGFEDIEDERFKELWLKGYRPVKDAPRTLEDKGFVELRYDSVMSPDGPEELLDHDFYLREMSDPNHPPQYAIAPYVNIAGSEKLNLLEPLNHRVAILQGVVPGLHEFSELKLPHKVLPYLYADPEILRILQSYEGVWTSREKLKKARQTLMTHLFHNYPVQERFKLFAHWTLWDRMLQKIIPESYMAMHYTSKYGSARAFIAFLNALDEGRRRGYPNLFGRPIVVFTFLQRGLIYPDTRGREHLYHDDIYRVIEQGDDRLQAKVTFYDLNYKHFHFGPEYGADSIIVINLPSLASETFNRLHFLSDAAVVAGDIGLNNGLTFAAKQVGGVTLFAPHPYSQDSLIDQFRTQIRERPDASEGMVDFYERTLSLYLKAQIPDYHGPINFVETLTEQLAGVFGQPSSSSLYRDMFASIVLAEKNMFNHFAAVVRELDSGRMMPDILESNISVPAGLEIQGHVDFAHYRALVTLSQAITGHGDARRAAAFYESLSAQGAKKNDIFLFLADRNPRELKEGIERLETAASDIYVMRFLFIPRDRRGNVLRDEEGKVRYLVMAKVKEGQAEKRSEVRTVTDETSAMPVWPTLPAKKIAVIGGAGFVGATKAVLLATDFGHDVVAMDVNAESVRRLNKGELVNYAPGLEELLQEGLDSKRLRFTTDLKDAIEGRDIIFLALPTPYRKDTGEANTEYLERAVADIAKLIRPGEKKILIGKSTAPPSTARRLREIIAKTELPEGAEIHLAWEPEFLREGKEIEDDRGAAGRHVIGADDPEVLKRIMEIYAAGRMNPKYRQEPVPMVTMDVPSAMLVKYAANGFRGTKINWINFISWIAQLKGFDINEVAGTLGKDKRIGNSFLASGLGFGGSCFPKDFLAFVRMLVGRVPYNILLDGLAVNDLQWRNFVRDIHDRLGTLEGKTIAILGGAFKPGTSDVREARSIFIINALLEKGARIRVYDPVAISFLKQEFAKQGLPETSAIEYVECPEAGLRQEDYEHMKDASAVVMVTEWDAFAKIDFGRLSEIYEGQAAKPPFFDGRNVWNPAEVAASGFEYHGMGHRAPLNQEDPAKVAEFSEFIDNATKLFLALRISFINMAAELAEQESANIRNIIRGLGKDPVVGEFYLDPGLGFGGDQLPAALEYFEKFSRSEKMRGQFSRFRQARERIQKIFGFGQGERDEIQSRVPFVHAIREINDRQVARYVQKAKEAMGGSLKDKRVTLLGLAYRVDTHSIENASSLKLIKALLDEGAIVRASDENSLAVYNVRQHLLSDGIHLDRVEFHTDVQTAVQGTDVAMLVTGWSRYQNWQRLFLKQNGGVSVQVPNVVDGRHFYNPDELKKAGIHYYAVGIPRSEARMSPETIREEFHNLFINTAARKGFEKIIVSFRKGDVLEGKMHVIFGKTAKPEEKEPGDVDLTKVDLPLEELEQIHAALTQDQEIGSAWESWFGFFSKALKQYIFLMREQPKEWTEELERKLDELEDRDIDGHMFEAHYRVEADSDPESLTGRKLVIELLDTTEAREADHRSAVVFFSKLLEDLKQLKSASISHEHLGGRVNRYRWSDQNFDYELVTAGGHLGPQIDLTMRRKGETEVFREELLGGLGEPDLFQAILDELEMKSSLEITQRSEARQSEGSDQDYRKMFAAIGLSDAEIGMIEDYTHHFLTHADHAPYVDQNQQALLVSLADPVRISIALRANPPKAGQVMADWFQNGVKIFAKFQRDFINQLPQDIVAKIYEAKLLQGEREGVIRNFLIGKMATAEGLTAEEKEVLAGLDPFRPLMEQGVRIRKIEDFSSARAVDEGAVIYKITLERNGHEIAIFFKASGRSTFIMKLLKGKRQQFFEDFFYRVTRRLGLNSIASDVYQDADPLLTGFTLMQEIKGVHTKNLFDQIPDSLRFRVKPQFVPYRRTLIESMAQFAAVSDLLHKGDRRIIQNENPEFPTNYMVRFDQEGDGEPAIYALDHAWIFNDENFSPASDLKKAGCSEMGILSAFDEFKTAAGRKELFQIYRAAYFEMWQKIYDQRQEIEGLVTATFGEGSLEHKIFLKAWKKSPAEYFREQKTALLDFVRRNKISEPPAARSEARLTASEERLRAVETVTQIDILFQEARLAIQEGMAIQNRSGKAYDNEALTRLFLNRLKKYGEADENHLIETLQKIFLGMSLGNSVAFASRDPMALSLLSRAAIVSASGEIKRQAAPEVQSRIMNGQARRSEGISSLFQVNRRDLLKLGGLFGIYTASNGAVGIGAASAVQTAVRKIATRDWFASDVIEDLVSQLAYTFNYTFDFSRDEFTPQQITELSALKYDKSWLLSGLGTEFGRKMQQELRALILRSRSQLDALFERVHQDAERSVDEDLRRYASVYPDPQTWPPDTRRKNYLAAMTHRLTNYLFMYPVRRDMDGLNSEDFKGWQSPFLGFWKRKTREYENLVRWIVRLTPEETRAYMERAPQNPHSPVRTEDSERFFDRLVEGQEKKISQIENQMDEVRTAVKNAGRFEPYENISQGVALKMEQDQRALERQLESLESRRDSLKQQLSGWQAMREIFDTPILPTPRAQIIARSEMRGGKITGALKTGTEISLAILGTRAVQGILGFAAAIFLLWTFFPLRLYIAPAATKANLNQAAQTAGMTITDKTKKRYFDNPHFYRGLARALIDSPRSRISQIGNITLSDEKPSKDDEMQIRISVDLKHGEIPNPPFNVSTIRFTEGTNPDKLDEARLADIVAMQNNIFGGEYKTYEQTKGIFGMVPNLLVWMISTGIGILTLVLWFSRSESSTSRETKKLPRQKTIDSHTWRQVGGFRSEARTQEEARNIPTVEVYNGALELVYNRQFLAARTQRDFTAEGLQAVRSHFDQDGKPLTGKAYNILALPQDQENMAALFKSAEDVRRFVTAATHVKPDEIFWNPDDHLHISIYALARTFLKDADIPAVLENPETFEKFRQIVAGIEPFEIEWRGITMGPTGVIILQGFVKNDGLIRLRAALAKEFPKSVFPHAHAYDVVHMTLGRFARPLGDARYLRLLNVISRLRNKSFGLTRIARLHYVRGVLKEGQRIGQESIEEVAELPLNGIARSEVRPSWVERENLTRVMDRTFVSRQMEAGIHVGLIEALEEKFGEEIAEQVAQTTLTGGLGALMHDLFEAWKKNGIDVIGINPIYEKIKGQRHVKGMTEDIELGRYLREVLTPTDIEFKLNLKLTTAFADAAFQRWSRARNLIVRDEKGPRFRDLKVKVFQTRTKFAQTPLYYLDIMYTDDSGRDISIFDEVYPDDKLWRDIHIAAYHFASVELVKILEARGLVKPKKMFVNNEVYVALPTGEERHDINHTVVDAGLYTSESVSYEMLGLPEEMREDVVQNGEINLTNVIALDPQLRLVTGVGLAEHTPVLGSRYFGGSMHRLKGYRKGTVRSTNGALFDKWQAPARRALINQHKNKLGMSPETDDKPFFEELRKQAEPREAFKERNELIAASDVGNFLMWLKSNQGNSLWLQKMVAEPLGISEQAAEDLLIQFKGAVATAALDESQWDQVIAQYGRLKEELMRNPIISNVRRWVGYKGPDKWMELLMSLRNDEKLLREFKESGARVVIGGRRFSHEAQEQFSKIRELVRILGLEDQIVMLENYNIKAAETIFRATSGMVMLSDENLEASATSMMKGAANFSAYIGVWGGAMPELFTILDKDGREIDIFNLGLPLDKVYDLIEQKVRAGEWTITNGYLVEYSPYGFGPGQEHSGEMDRSRRPRAASLFSCVVQLARGSKKREDRQNRQFEVIANSYKVDMERGQARAHAYLWEEAIKEKEDEDNFYAALDISFDEIAKVLSMDGDGFLWSEAGDQYFKSRPGLEGFLEGFLKTRFIQRKGKKEKVMFGILKHHATNQTISPYGDIFNYLLNYIFKGIPEAPGSFKSKLQGLANLARGAEDIDEKVRLNVMAIHLAMRYLDKAEAMIAGPQFAEWIVNNHLKGKKTIARAFRHGSIRRVASEYVRSKTLQEGGAEYLKRFMEKTLVSVHNEEEIAEIFREPWIKEKLIEYLEGLAEQGIAQSYKITSKKAKVYSFPIKGEDVLIAVNFGEFKFPSPRGPKAWITVNDIGKFLDFLKQKYPQYSWGSQQVHNYVTREVHGHYGDLEEPEKNLRKRGLPVGIPDRDVDILQIRVEPEERLAGLIDAAIHGLLVEGDKQAPEVMQEVLEKIFATDSKEKIREVIQTLASYDKEKALRRFSYKDKDGIGIPPVMALIAFLFPDMFLSAGVGANLETWNPKVYRRLSTIIQRPEIREILAKGELKFHKDVDPHSGFVVSRFYGGHALVIPIHFTPYPVRHEDGKAWFRLEDVAPLGIENSKKLYQVFDHYVDQGYGKHEGEKLYREGYHLGIPVKAGVTDNWGVTQEGLHFQFLEISAVPLAQDPASRSEIRTAVENVLTVLAQGEPMEASVAEEFAAVAQDHFDAVVFQMTTEAPVFMENRGLVQRALADYSAFENGFDLFVSEENLERFENRLRRHLDTHQDGTLNFSWVMPFTADHKIQTWLSGFLNRVGAISQESAYRGRISARVAMVISKEQKPDIAAFKHLLKNSDMIQEVDESVPVRAAKDLNTFLDLHPNALMYALPEGFESKVRRNHQARIVELAGLSWREAFPISTIINFKTAQEKSEITAELLKKLPEIFSERMVAYQGGRLTILEFARQFVLEAAMDRYIAQMA